MEKLIISTKNGYELLNNENFDEAIIELKKALNYAKQIESKDVVNKCVQNLAAAYIECGRRDDINRGIELLKLHTNSFATTESAYTNYNIGIGHEKLENHPESLKCFERTLKQIEKNKTIDFDDQDLYNLCLSMSKLYLRDENLAQAALINTRISDLCISIRLQNDLLLKAANYLQQAKDNKRCLNLMKKCFKNCSNIGNDSDYEATVKNTIGLLSTEIGANTLASECFENARAVSRMSKNKELVAISSQNLGVVMNLNQQYSSSLKYHKEAFQIYKELKLIKNQAETAINLAYAYYKTNKLSECEECLSIVIKIGSRDLQWLSYGHMSEIYYIQEDWEALRGCLIESIKVAPKDERKNLKKRLDEIGKSLEKDKNYKKEKLTRGTSFIK